MINIDMYINELEKKWGKFIKKNSYFEQGKMPFVSKQARLNVLFEPLKDAEIKFIESKLGSLPDSLIAFYQKTNGCRLFFGSFNILGLRKNLEDIFEPYGILEENLALNLATDTNIGGNENYVFFASIGGDYFFAYKKEEKCQVYCMKKGDFKILKTFNNFQDFFEYYFYKLYQEYGTDCKKIHILPEDKDFPLLAHLTIEI